MQISDERVQRFSSELKSTKDILIEEQERYIKIDSIKKSLEVEVRSMQQRLEEIEANALAGGKRVIAKLESRIRDVEIELEEEKRRHSETEKILRKKEHRVKELMIQSEDDHKNVVLLQEACDKLNEKVKVYKRQMQEQVSRSEHQQFFCAMSMFLRISSDSSTVQSDHLICLFNLLLVYLAGRTKSTESVQSKTISARTRSG